MIQTIEDLHSLLIPKTYDSSKLSSYGSLECVFTNDKIVEFYCNNCQGERRHKTKLLTGTRDYYSTKYTVYPEHQSNKQLDLSSPMLFKAECTQCDENVFLIIYANDRYDARFQIIHSTERRHHVLVPEGVNYYLDQAGRSSDAGANTAAVAMYRSSLEWILMDQNISGRDLKDRIENLFKMIGENRAPFWAMGLDQVFLNAIRELGNFALHTNKGDITVQNSLDSELVKVEYATIAELLDKIYIQPAKSKANRDYLINANSQVKEKNAD